LAKPPDQVQGRSAEDFMRDSGRQETSQAFTHEIKEQHREQPEEVSGGYDETKIVLGLAQGDLLVASNRRSAHGSNVRLKVSDQPCQQDGRAGGVLHDARHCSRPGEFFVGCKPIAPSPRQEGNKSREQTGDYKSHGIIDARPADRLASHRSAEKLPYGVAAGTVF
jgi:hypothetical protein